MHPYLTQTTFLKFMCGTALVRVCVVSNTFLLLHAPLSAPLSPLLSLPESVQLSATLAS
jgi:hypothetical protein